MPGTSFNLPQLDSGAIGARLTKLFFDRDLVDRHVDAATKKVLSRFGYFVRQDAKESIRRPRRKPLSAFTPRELESYRRRQRQFRRGEIAERPKRPLESSQPGTPPRNQTGLLKRFIFFTFDPSARSVVIGPARLAGSRSTPPVPQILEYGGHVSTFGRRARIEPRPYMRPAFDRQLDKHMPEMWRNSVR